MLLMNKRKTRVQCREIDHDEWNAIIDKLKHNHYLLFLKEYQFNSETPLGHRLYIWEGKSFAYMYYGYQDCSYFRKTNLAEDKRGQYIGSGTIALIQLTKSLDREYKELIHQYDDREPLFSANSILWYNKDYNLKRIDNCIGYDINSAFSYAMVQDMPDTRKPLGPGIVRSGEIGFTLIEDLEDYVNIDGPLYLRYMREEGEYASIRFPLIPSFFCGFVDKYYSMKKNPKDLNEKQKAKQMLNYSIGILQNHNFFIRARILELCNKRIINLINKYRDIIVFSNTDSIVSTRPIPEIEANIGNGLGQWKIEHTGNFAIDKFAYQWNYDETTYRGIPKMWFRNYEKNYGHKFNILIDKLPDYGNDFKVNKDGKIIQQEVE